MKLYEFLKVKTDLTENEKEVFLMSGVTLPPLYHFFSQLFEVGDETFKKISYLEDNELCQLGTWTFRVNGEKIHLEEFLSLDKILASFPVASQDNEWIKHKLLRVAYLGQAGFGGLYLGCSSNNLDEIWVFNSDSECQFTKVSENIFTFLKQISFDTEFGDFESDYSNLYKNWGEDFWRIREVNGKM